MKILRIKLKYNRHDTVYENKLYHAYYTFVSNLLTHIISKQIAFFLCIITKTIFKKTIRSDK